MAPTQQQTRALCAGASVNSDPQVPPDFPPLHAGLLPPQRPPEPLVQSHLGVAPFKVREDVGTVLVHLFAVDGDCRGAAPGGGGDGFHPGPGRSGGLLGHGTAQAVEPLLLVVDVVHLQGVGLTVGRIQRAHTEHVLG